MSSDYEQLAAAVLPPKEGNIRVLAITTSASTVQDAIGADNATRGFLTVIADVDFYITFTGDGSNTVTSPDSTSTAGGSRTWLVPAKQPLNVFVTQFERYFKVRGSGSGIVRWYLSSR